MTALRSKTRKTAQVADRAAKIGAPAELPKLARFKAWWIYRSFLGIAAVFNYGRHLQKSSNGRYRFSFRRCKSACRSKPPQGITLKKLESGDENSNSSPPESGEVIKKRKHEEVIPSIEIVESVPEIAESVPEIAESGPEIAESVQSDDDDISRKRRKIRDVISECGSIDEYEDLDPISQGTYGEVCRALHKETGEIVAIKKEHDGLSEETQREIDILKSLGPHPRIVEFKRVVVNDSDVVYIVMEYMENDLEEYMHARETPLEMGEVKSLMWQLLEGVEFLHRNGVMHRDLKPSNVLINNGTQLKICDFGLSRNFDGKSGAYTPELVTLRYRAPELLLGVELYSSAVDMWSVGCIMAELVLKKFIFCGKSEIEQLGEIYKVLGTPNEADWPGFLDLAGSKVKVVEQPNNLLREKLCETELTEAGFDLLERLLTYDPAKRITAESALDHAWFNEIDW